MTTLDLAPTGPPPRRWHRNAVFGIIGATIVLGWVGDALWASLVDRHPLTLILLNAKPRYLVLTVNQLDPVTYYLVGTARLLVTKPLVWLVGGWYGHRAVSWVERRSERGAPLMRWVERHFARWGWAVVLITSNNAVCLLAGASGFPLLWFMVLAVIGTVVRLWIFAQVGDIFSEPIDQLIDVVVRHRVPVVAASIAVVVIVLFLQHRSGRSDLDDLSALERAMDDDTAAEETGLPSGD